MKQAMRKGRLMGRLRSRPAGLPALLALLALAGLLGLPAAPAAQGAEALRVARMALRETRVDAGAPQFVQITLANGGRRAVHAGLKVELRDEDDRRVGSAMTRRVTIGARDDARVFFRFRAPPRPGRYAVQFEPRTADFKKPLIAGGPVFFAPFVVGAVAPLRREAPAVPEAPREARIEPPRFQPPSRLRFERPDLVWENVSVTPSSLLVGEPLHVRTDLRNTGGDIARGIAVSVSWFHTRTPTRLNTISDTEVQVLAPGEKIELEFEVVLPEDALLGEYRVKLEADVGDRVEESDEENNAFTTASIRLSRIKLVFPEPGFAFEEAGLFLFRWDSLRFDEFKVQVGTDPAFADEASFFDLPQGEKWTREKEIVPLEGELPAMAKGLMERTGTTSLYWRVVGRDSETGQMGFSAVRPFTITPEEAPEQAAPPAGAAPPPAREGEQAEGRPAPGGAY